MTEEPYKTPDSELIVEDKLEVPDKILMKIRLGWIVALISGVFTLVFIFYDPFGGGLVDDPFEGGLFDAWNFIDVVIIFTLAFGIYRKSRIAATIMFVQFLVSKIIVFLEFEGVGNILLNIIFLYIFFQAMIGTYQFHKLVKNS